MPPIRHCLLLFVLTLVCLLEVQLKPVAADTYGPPLPIAAQCMQEAQYVFPVFHAKRGARLVGARTLIFKVKEFPVQTLAHNDGPSCDPVGNLSVAVRVGKQDSHGRMVFGPWVYILRHSNAGVHRWFGFPFRHHEPYRCKPGPGVEPWELDVRKDAHYDGQPPMHDVTPMVGIGFDGDYGNEC